MTSNRSGFLVTILAYYVFVGCALFMGSVLTADYFVPGHNWMGDTISDLAAGQYEFIVDTGLYAFSAALVSVALLASHLHFGGKRWSLGIIGFAMLGLIVFLVGARNEYGDSDNEGVVIHIYLVYAIGALMTALPLLMINGAQTISERYGPIFIGVASIWTVSAPLFFFFPDGYDGIYERYLGGIALFFVCVVAHMFLWANQGMPKKG